MDEQPVKTRKQLEAQLIDKAIKDASFRQDLVREITHPFAWEPGMHGRANMYEEEARSWPKT